MSVKISVYGFLEDFTGAQVVPSTANNEKPLVIQKVWVKVPAYTDQFGEKKGQDKIWEFQIMGQDKITSHNINGLFKLQDKVTVTAWLDCNNPVKDGKMSYIYNATLTELQKF